MKELLLGMIITCLMFIACQGHLRAHDARRDQHGECAQLRQRLVDHKAAASHDDLFADADRKCLGSEVLRASLLAEQKVFRERHCRDQNVLAALRVAATNVQERRRENGCPE